MYQPQTPSQAFIAAVRDTLDVVRRDPSGSLEIVPLALQPLVEDMYRVAESSRLQTHMLRAVLEWAIDEIEIRPSAVALNESKPKADLNATMPHLLRLYYLENRTVDQVLIELDIARATFHKRCTKAINALAYVLYNELQAPTPTPWRMTYVVRDRYYRQPQNAQEVLQLLTMFNHPVAPSLLAKLLPDGLDLQAILLMLSQAGWLGWNATETAVQLVDSTARQVVKSCFKHHEASAWNQQIAHYYHQQQQYFEAVQHWCAANDAPKAIDILWQDWNKIRERYDATTLLNLLHELDAPTQESEAKLHLLAGYVNAMLGQRFKALKYYVDASNLLDQAITDRAKQGEVAYHLIYLKAEAHHDAAEIYKSMAQFSLFLEHYQDALQLLEIHAPNSRLRARLFIDRAWLYLQERKNLAAAAEDLAAAERIIDAPSSRLQEQGIHLDRTSPAELRSDLSNARARLAYERNEVEHVLDNRGRALDTALRANDPQRQLKTMHNLGKEYIWNGTYRLGEDLVRTVLELAMQSGERNMEGLCHKTLGTSYFFQGQYQAAEQEYLQAQQIWESANQANWNMQVCFDLAEVYVKLFNFRAAHEYYSISQRMALQQQADHQANNQELLKLLASLAAQYPTLTCSEPISVQQQQAVDYVVAHAAITNSMYRKLTGVSQSTAATHLQQLIDPHQVLQDTGQGRNYRYILKPPPA